jgi:RNA polymerase sigma-70 factor (ECF subfamily)
MQATEFERFFKENYSKIYYLALSLVHDDEVARDIVADSFEYLFSHHVDLQIAEACNFYPSHPSRSLFFDL